MSKKCERCGTVNSDASKFCSNCGTILQNKTPEEKNNKIDSTDDIVWENTTKYKRGFIITSIIFVIISVLNCLRWTVGIILTWNWNDWNDIYSSFWEFLFRGDMIILFVYFQLLPLVISIFLTLFIKSIRNRLTENATLIEKTKSPVAIITKNNTLGLFNKKNGKILLTPRYSNIKRVGQSTFILEQGGKYNLYHKNNFIMVDTTYDNITKVMQYHVLKQLRQLNKINICFVLCIIISSTLLFYPIFDYMYRSSYKYKQEINVFDEEDATLEETPVEIPIYEMEDEELEEEEREIFTVVEQQATFPGGVKELNKYLAQNIKYPQQARETGTQGKVYLTFVVEKDGSITDIKILRDIGSGCGEEAIRVVKSMPRWTPAMQRGKKVSKTTI